MPDNDSYKIKAEIKDFIYNNNDRYIKLLTDVKNFLSNLKSEHAHDQIYRVYSRADNRNATNEFKSTERVSLKLTRWRQEDNNVKIHHIHDIIGASIVVFYEDSIDKVFKIIKKNCKNYNLEISLYRGKEETKRYTNNGYHAQHFVLESRSPNLRGLKCEVQIKTLLHDAWQAKTHDLIYKPQGELNSNHKKIMESFGESIQAIEIQSETIRKIVTQDWEDEEDLRHAARITLIDWLEKKTFEDENINRSYQKIINVMLTRMQTIKSCKLNDHLIKHLIEEISFLRSKGSGIDAAWPLMVSLSSIRQDNHLNYLAKEYLDDWLRKIDNPALACLYKSFSYHMIGERIEAINEIDQFLMRSNLDNQDHRNLKFNLLYYLIEEASYSSESIKALKEKCDRYILYLDTHNWEGIPDASVKDTKGYYQIVFGSTRAEIEKGIRTCQEAISRSEDDNQSRKSFSGLHERIGWRRYLRARS